MKKLFLELYENNIEFSEVESSINMECHVVKENNGVYLVLHPLCSYFDKNIYQAAVKKWNDSFKRICYDEAIPINKFVFSPFKGSAFE